MWGEKEMIHTRIVTRCWSVTCCFTEITWVPSLDYSGCQNPHEYTSHTHTHTHTHSILDPDQVHIGLPPLLLTLWSFTDMFNFSFHTSLSPTSLFLFFPLSSHYHSSLSTPWPLISALPLSPSLFAWKHITPSLLLLLSFDLFPFCLTLKLSVRG